MWIPHYRSCSRREWHAGSRREPDHAPSNASAESVAFATTLYIGNAGWVSSPVYDVYPMPVDVKPRILSTAIDNEYQSAARWRDVERLANDSGAFIDLLSGMSVDVQFRGQRKRDR